MITGCAPSAFEGPSRLAISELESAAYCGDVARGVRWLDDTTLFISMGEQPTAGYGIRLAADEVVQDDGVWLLRVHWREPGADEPVAQVLTRPCLKVLFAERVREPVRVMDAAGKKAILQTDD